MGRLDELMRQNFIDYASYSILDRAIPDIRDGLKPVQRRILHTLASMNDGRFHKVANVIGETMKLHPHGDASIGSALVVLANKDYFIERQGNFGSVLTGHPAAAARYIECRLTELALATLFDDDLTEFVDSYDGRSREPVFLPAKLPVALMLGSEGIAVGMATRILPHNLVELWEAQIACLRGEEFRLVPDFVHGGSMDVSAYDDGRGKVEVRARLEGRGAKRLAIREIPYGTTTESLIASIEAAVQKGRVQVASIDDYTAESVEIELRLARGATSEEVTQQLYAYTDCSISISSNLIVIRDGRPVELTVTEVLHDQVGHLVEVLRRELEWERSRLLERKHWLTLERIFVEERVYQAIEGAATAEAIRDAVRVGMEPHAERFVRPMDEEDVDRLLALRIRRISAFDLEKNRGEIATGDARLEEIATSLSDMIRTAIEYVQGLIDRFGDAYPRRTTCTDHEVISKDAVAQPTIKLIYDADSGFFGSNVRASGRELRVTEFDLILAITDDGVYRVMPPPEKVLLEGRVLHLEVFDRDAGAAFTLVYRDSSRMAFGKRVRIEKFIRNREYRLIKDAGGHIDLLLPGDAKGTLTLDYVPTPRQRVSSGRFDLKSLEFTGISARGTRLAPKAVRKIRFSRPPAPKKRRGRSPRQTSLF